MPGGTPRPDDAEVREALARVVASPAFQNAPQLVAFLTFVVEKTLARQAGTLKGYTIATQAFGRPETFDPQADPIVRVEAGRLRRALDAYYVGPGADDALRISIPRGAYVPAFSRVEAAPAVPAADESSLEPAPAAVPPPEPPRPAPAARGRPARWRRRAAAVLAFAAAVLAAILILPAGWDEADSWFDEILHAPGTRAARAVPQRVDGRPLVVVEPLDDDEGTAGLSPLTLRDLVLDGLARFDEISVVDQVAGTRVVSDADRYLLALRVISAGEAVTVSASLSHAPSGKMVWARSFDPAKRSDPESPPEPDIARQIATSVGQPYGVLFADLRTRPDLDQRTRCIVQSYDHWRLPSRDSHARGRDCLETSVREQPHAATAFANLAYFYLEEFRIGHNARPDPLERALRAARRAIEIAPESPRTNQALMDVLFARDDIEAALARGRRALELNPYDTDILAGVGAKLVQTGRYREGAELIQKAEAANAAPPPWYDFYLFLAAFMQDDWLVAKPAAARIETSDFVLGLLAKIAVAARERRQAPDLIARLVAIQPEFGTNPQSALAKRNFEPAIQSRLLEALRQAGLRA